MKYRAEIPVGREPNEKWTLWTRPGAGGRWKLCGQGSYQEMLALAALQPRGTQANYRKVQTKAGNDATENMTEAELDAMIAEQLPTMPDDHENSADRGPRGPKVFPDRRSRR